MKIVNSAKSIAAIAEGRLYIGMDRDALLYVLSFVNPKARAVAARQAQRHMFNRGFYAKKNGN
ncbi:hypothetical protein [Burkholderia multivorans]|uniref:hypothetical protein n=1 Tax=Burkholderia multivorans TaxID=87883 RepID=UPI0021BE170C|nr:hypothetical protein [Burkholderia multivorans]